MDDPLERTREPSPQQRERAARAGRRVHSRELPAALLLAAVALSAWWLAPLWLSHLTQIFVLLLGSPPQADATREARSLLSALTPHLLIVTVPVLVGIPLALLIGHLAQTRFRLGWSAGLHVNTPPLLREDGLIQALLHVGKALAAVLVLAWSLWHDGRTLLNLPRQSLSGALTGGATVLGLLAVRLAAVWAILAALDWLVHWWLLERSLRLTPQQQKEELRDQEGDPDAKSRRRNTARRMLSQHLDRDVPKSDVVLLSPNELAVAIEYDPGQAAPRVVAKGTGVLALRIAHLAREHRVPLVERAELAWDLYRRAEVGNLVAEEFYADVATLIATAGDADKAE